MKYAPHTSSAFDRDLESLACDLSALTVLVEAQIVEAIEQIGTGNKLSNKVPLQATAVKAMHLRIEEAAVLTIARRQPMAIDLREVIGAFKTGQHLRQIGVLAAIAAEYTRAISRSDCPEDLLKKFSGLGQQAIRHFRETTGSYLQSDVVRAVAMSAQIRTFSDIAAPLAREVIDFMHDGTGNIELGIHLMLYIDGIGRMVMHMAGIADATCFVCEGHSLVPDLALDGAFPIAAG